MRQYVWVYMSYSMLVIPFILATPLSIVFVNTFLDCVALFYVNPILAASLQWVAAPGWESVFIAFNLYFQLFLLVHISFSTGLYFHCLLYCMLPITIMNWCWLFSQASLPPINGTFSFSILLAQQSLTVGYREQERTCVWYLFAQANIPTKFLVR